MTTLTKMKRAAFEAHAAEAASLLRALASERRLLILCELGDDELSVGEIQERLDVSQSALSQHLAVLREQGLVSTRREAQMIFYRIADPAAVKVIATLASIYCPEKSR
jgi:ArsR family transcriptional regulator, virulence genes transcriptional regulator